MIEVTSLSPLRPIVPVARKRRRGYAGASAAFGEIQPKGAE